MQTKYKISVIEIEEYSGNNIKDVRELHKNLQNECAEILSILEEISLEAGDDYGMKSSLIEDVKYHECCYMIEKEFELIENMMLMENLDTTDVNAVIETESIIAEYNSIVEPQSLKLQTYLVNFTVAQEKFAEANNHNLDEGNPLDQRYEALENE